LPMKLNGFNTTDSLSKTQLLMIKACIAKSASGHSAAVREWEATVVMNEMDYRCLRLVPFFMHKNKQWGIATLHDKRLKVIYKYWWLKTQHTFNQLKVVNATLLKHGIQPIVIKGASIMSFYVLPELRSMADFDVLIRPAEIKKALEILKTIGYEADKAKEPLLFKHFGLITAFSHSFDFTHSLTGTRLDLHWKFGSLCSKQFNEKLMQNLESYSLLPGALKPSIEYEVFMIIIHAVVNRQMDNLNWIVDIALLNSKENKNFWDKARKLAVLEKKEHLFDYGCYILLQHGVYAPIPGNVNAKVDMLTFTSGVKLPKMKLYATLFKNLRINIKYRFPNTGFFVKSYQAIRFARYRAITKNARK